jgi:DNA-binding protein Fis
LLQASGSVLLPAFLPELSQRSLPSTPAGAGTFDLDAFIRDRLTPEASDVYAETLGQVDRLLFTRALEFTEGNHRDAARVLGISRQTMRVKMRALGLHVARSVESDDDA